MSDQRCAACGLSFGVNEFRAMQGDGSVLHDETQPLSMRRCRAALLTKLRGEPNDNAVILGLDPKECDSIYPRTRDGRCQGCGIVGEHPR